MFYSLKEILKRNATYNIVIGERSNGKTFAGEDYALKEFCDSGYKNQLAMIRRNQEDFKGKRAPQMFDGIVSEGRVKKYTKGEWTGIDYYSGRWYLCREGETGKLERMERPFAFAFAVSTMEHDKSSSYPDVTNIIYDEFLTRDYYLQNEFVLYMNVLSTIIRHRDNVKIFMFGNTVNKYCPYFEEMGLTHVKNMEQGMIDLYEYGESGLTVAVEYAAPTNKSGKKSDKYFAFDNPKLNMITGGKWEIDIYPHLPKEVNQHKVAYRYFIKFNDNTLQCDIVSTDQGYITFIHEKTGEIKNPEKDIVFSTDISYRRNIRVNLLKPTDNIGKKIAKQFNENKIFYQSNEVGEVVRNYLMWCKKGL